MPGFITSFDSNGDDIEVYRPYYKNNKVCSLKHCGIVAISKSYLEKLQTIGSENLKKLFEKSNGDQEVYRKEIDDFSAST